MFSLNVQAEISPPSKEGISGQPKRSEVGELIWLCSCKGKPVSVRFLTGTDLRTAFVASKVQVLQLNLIVNNCILIESIKILMWLARFRPPHGSSSTLEQITKLSNFHYWLCQYCNSNAKKQQISLDYITDNTKKNMPFRQKGKSQDVGEFLGSEHQQQEISQKTGPVTQLLLLHRVGDFCYRL